MKIEVPPKVSFAAAPTPPAKPVRKKRKDFDTNRLHALLDKSADKPEKSLSEKLAKLKEAAPQPAPQKISDLPLTMTEIDAIRYQIEQCWSVPGGARDARDLIVRIKVFLHPDGSLAQAPQIIDDNGRMGEAFYRTAAESARRAVLTCAPFKSLPVGKYNSWREITLTFNPREMLGG